MPNRAKRVKHRVQPLPPSLTMPTMYDLPSEAAGESGMPDEFHLLQPRLLTDTFVSRIHPPEKVFMASDLNIYYDAKHSDHYKRPDWFIAVGVERLYENRDMRLSWVRWQEGTDPLMIVELLSPGTEKEDLGESKPRRIEDPPSKWEVYETRLRVPYYVVFSRYTDELKVFRLTGARYVEMTDHNGRIWIEELGLGLGVREGEYEGVTRKWLRWYDENNQWIPTKAELAETQRQAKEAALEQAETQRQAKEAALEQAETQRRAKEAALEQAETQRQAKEAALEQAETQRRAKEAALERAERLAAKLKELGVDPDAP